MTLPTLKVSSERIRHKDGQQSSHSSSSHHSRPNRQASETAIQKQKEHKELEAAVEEWMSFTLGNASELAARFDKKPRYFLDRFFSGRKTFIYKQSVTNSFNAFKSVKSAQLRAEGEKENAIAIQRDYIDEYNSLTEEEHAEYVAEFEATKSSSLHLPRTTARGCIADVSNICRNMRALIDSLKTRVGVEGFFCIVHSSTSYHSTPEWYFTSKELADYMPIAVGKKWCTSTVAAKVEAFAIAGCDIMNLQCTSQQKAVYLKREIAAAIGADLVSITGNDKAVMKYTDYEKGIVQHYGVELAGWTHEKFCNPSELGNALQPLITLHEAIQSGSCKFRKLMGSELRECKAKYQADVASGAIIVKPWKTRKDASTKRKSSDNSIPPAKQIRSDSVIGDSSDEVKCEDSNEALPESILGDQQAVEVEAE